MGGATRASYRGAEGGHPGQGLSQAMGAMNIDGKFIISLLAICKCGWLLALCINCLLAFCMLILTVLSFSISR